MLELGFFATSNLQSFFRMVKGFVFSNLKLLIDGYLRTINRSSFVIPPLVYKLCVAFRQGSAQHLWTVNPVTLRQTKNCANGQRVLSPTFEIEYLTWRFEVFPNGDGTESEGEFEIRPILYDLPLTWGEIECFIVIRCLETISTCFCAHDEIEKGVECIWEKRLIPLKMKTHITSKAWANS